MEHLGVRLFLTRKKHRLHRQRQTTWLRNSYRFTLLLHRPNRDVTRTLKESSLSVRETNHLIYM